MPNYNPSTGEVSGQNTKFNKEGCRKSIRGCGKKHFQNGSNTTLEERSKILSKIAALILEHLDILAVAESKDNGKPLSLAREVDVPRVC